MSLTYKDVPNSPHRAQVMAAARQPRPTPATFNALDAFQTVGMLGKLRDAVVVEKTRHPLIQALTEAWGGRRA